MSITVCRFDLPAKFFYFFFFFFSRRLAQFSALLPPVGKQKQHSILPLTGGNVCVSLHMEWRNDSRSQVVAGDAC